MKAHRKVEYLYPSLRLVKLRLNHARGLRAFSFGQDRFEFTLLEADASYKMGISKPQGRIIWEGNYVQVDPNNFTIPEFRHAMIENNRRYMESARFSTIDGKQYPSFIKVARATQAYNPSKPNPYSIVTIWFDKVVKNKFQRIKGETNVRNSARYLELMDYDTTFWNSYEPLNKHPINSGLKKGLERHQPLVEQFAAPKQLFWGDLFFNEN